MRKIASLIFFLIAVASCAPEPMDSREEVTGEWHHAGGSHFSEKYAALDQINTKNFKPRLDHNSSYQVILLL